MKKEVSDKVIVTLLILAIFFSVLGTIIVYQSVNNFKETLGEIQVKQTSNGAAGFVSLNVPEITTEGGESNEDIQ